MMYRYSTYIVRACFRPKHFMHPPGTPIARISHASRRWCQYGLMAFEAPRTTDVAMFRCPFSRTAACTVVYGSKERRLDIQLDGLTT